MMVCVCLLISQLLINIFNSLGYLKKLIEIGLDKWADSAERYVNERMNPPLVYGIHNYQW